MKILFAVRHDGADAYFRAVAPATMLRYQGIEAEVGQVALEDADKFDVLVLQRHCSPGAELAMRAFQAKGKPVIYDTDDWLGGMPPVWPAYDQYFYRGTSTPTELMGYHERLLRQADMVTCTVPALAERMRTFNETVRIVPNCIMWGDWDTVLPVEQVLEGPTIGWFGVPYYWDSWRQIHEAVEQAVCEVDGYLVILGYPEVGYMFSDRLLARTFVQPMVVWRRFDQMRPMIVSFDVGLAWVEDTPFNRCKSPLKAFQYGAAGVPIVASKVVYSDVLSDNYPGEFGILADTPDAVYHAILNVIKHPEARRIIADKWRQRVFTLHSYETQWQRWADVILEALGRD